MRGRKPKPTHIKLVAGNPGKRPLPKHEPKPKAAVPKCPPHLGPEAQREWRRMSKELSGLGLLTRIDTAVFAAYCQAWGRWVEAEEAMKEHGGPVVKAKKTGVAMISPFLSVANKAMDQMRQFAEQLGMSPSSRTRISAMPPPTPASDWDGLDVPYALLDSELRAPGAWDSGCTPPRPSNGCPGLRATGSKRSSSSFCSESVEGRDASRLPESDLDILADPTAERQLTLLIITSAAPPRAAVHARRQVPEPLTTTGGHLAVLGTSGRHRQSPLFNAPSFQLKTETSNQLQGKS